VRSPGIIQPFRAYFQKKIANREERGQNSCLYVAVIDCVSLGKNGRGRPSTEIPPKMAIHFSRVGRPLKAPFSVRYFGRFLADELLVRRREGDTRRYPQQQSLQLGIISPSVLSFQLPSSNLYRHITAKVLSPPPLSPHSQCSLVSLFIYTFYLKGY